jgi:4-hydroxythreonine-4-phosphate dehydrogenase
MPQVLILADDLSGAADCGVACVKAGLDVELSLGPSRSPSSANVVAIDADTRGLSSDQASRRMHDLTLLWGNDSSTLLFKKIDSTLRGHIGSELAAVLAARRVNGHRPLTVMAPAFPAKGRTTVAGMHFVDGQPLHETEMWRNQKPREEAHIPGMLIQWGLRCRHLDLAAVRNGLQPDSQNINDTDVLICDAATEEDLRAIAKLAAGIGPRAVWVGSAGLAHHICEALEIKAPRDSTRSAAKPPRGPALFVIGTASRKTREQTKVLLSSSNIHGVSLAPEVLLGGPETSEWRAVSRELATALQGGKDVALFGTSEGAIDTPPFGRLSAALAHMTAGLRDQVGTLIASGGETARKVLDGWDVRTLRLHGELELGVPISSATLPGSVQLTVVTKAGDFGQPDTLLNCLHWVKERGTRG